MYIYIYIHIYILHIYIYIYVYIYIYIYPADSRSSRARVWKAGWARARPPLRFGFDRVTGAVRHLRVIGHVRGVV